MGRVAERELLGARRLRARREHPEDLQLCRLSFISRRQSPDYPTRSQLFLPPPHERTGPLATNSQINIYNNSIFHTAHISHNPWPSKSLAHDLYPFFLSRLCKKRDCGRVLIRADGSAGNNSWSRHRVRTSACVCVCVYTPLCAPVRLRVMTVRIARRRACIPAPPLPPPTPPPPPPPPLAPTTTIPKRRRGERKRGARGLSVCSTIGAGHFSRRVTFTLPWVIHTRASCRYSAEVRGFSRHVAGFPPTWTRVCVCDFLREGRDGAAWRRWLVLAAEHRGVSIVYSVVWLWQWKTPKNTRSVD